MLQEAAATNNAWNEGLNDQAFAELFHHHHGIDWTAAKAAIFFAKRRHEEAELSKLGPHFWAPTALAFDHTHTRVEVILLTDQPGEAVSDHGLLFGEIKVHGVVLRSILLLCFC